MSKLPAGTQLHLWRSYFAPGDDVYLPTESVFFHYDGPVAVVQSPDGSAAVNVSMRSNGIYTISTIVGSRDFQEPPPSGPFPTAYSSSMAVGKEGQRAPFMLDIAGVFEGYVLPGDSAPRITQVVPSHPISWQGDLAHPMSLVAGVNRTSVTASVSVRPADESRGYPDRGFAGLAVLQHHYFQPENGVAPRSFVVFKNGTWLF